MQQQFLQLNDKVNKFVAKNNLDQEFELITLRKEYGIEDNEVWQKTLQSYNQEGRGLKIGIIGRVKAGKSSLLNALLFDGNNVLPQAATPMTAALTIMKYSEKLYAEVEFFTEKDIEQIKGKHREANHYLEMLKNRYLDEFTESLGQKKPKLKLKSGHLKRQIQNLKIIQILLLLINMKELKT